MSTIELQRYSCALAPPGEASPYELELSKHHHAPVRFVEHRREARLHNPFR